MSVPDLATILAKNNPSPYPIRQHRPSPIIPALTPISRVCDTCRSDFLALAPGKTGERGIWRDWRWFCSVECDPERAKP